MDKSSIVVGKPLPFSIYGADNTLLLAQGELVKSEGVRGALLRGGAYCKRRDAGAASGGLSVSARDEQQAADSVTALEKYVREYAPTLSKLRPNLRMSRDDSSESYATRIIGMHERSSLILAAPVRADKTLVPVFDRQTWLFRALYYTTAIRFQSLVLKSAFEPFPYLHVEVPRTVERKLVRGAPRVPVCLRTSLTEPADVVAAVVDLSLGGARIAVEGDIVFEPQQRLCFTVNVIVNQRSYPVNLAGTVLPRESSEEGLADVIFYRLRFESLDDLTMLALEAYLNGLLAMDADCFWRLMVQGPKQDLM